MNLRRDLAGERDSLPDEPFYALEIQVDDSWYLLPTRAVREVIPMLWCEPLAEAPSWVLGTFRYRGRTLVGVDLQSRLAGTSLEPHPSRVVVVLREPHDVGCFVYAVGDLMQVDPRQLAEPAAGVPYAALLLGSTTGRHGEIRHLLSVSRLASAHVLAEEDLADSSASRGD